jgi:hypothetical protein
MRSLREIETDWLLRPLRRFRVDGSQVRLWTRVLVVGMGLAITLALAMIVLARINTFIYVFEAY